MTGAAGALLDQDPRLAHNCIYLSGVLADEPQRDKDRNGEPIVVLKIAFEAPDPKETSAGAEVAFDEVEVPEPVAEKHGGQLRLGDSIHVTGQLSGGGGLIATQIHSGPPPASGSTPSKHL